MKVGVYLPSQLPESFRVYVENVGREIEALGVALVPFADAAILPDGVDLYWDPRSGGGHPPLASLRSAGRPFVVTVHGVAPLALSAREYFPTWRERLESLFENRAKRRRWRDFRGRCAAIISVSEYGRDTTRACLGLEGEPFVVCYHGVDHEKFSPGEAAAGGDAYFLHISNDEPRKNLDRIVAAYRRIAGPQTPRLVLKLPRGTRRRSGGGIEVIARRCTDEEIAALYRGATAFLFPSLYEGFGLPILEAMASGCPVVTADGNACAEVAGDAALRVDPRSVPALAEAMRRLAEDETLRRDLIARGLDRAAGFTWRRSAEAHYRVFAAAAGRAPHTPPPDPAPERPRPDDEGHR